MLCRVRLKRATTHLFRRDAPNTQSGAASSPLYLKLLASKMHKYPSWREPQPFEIAKRPRNKRRFWLDSNRTNQAISEPINLSHLRTPAKKLSRLWTGSQWRIGFLCFHREKWLSQTNSWWFFPQLDFRNEYHHSQQRFIYCRFVGGAASSYGSTKSHQSVSQTNSHWCRKTASHLKDFQFPAAQSTFINFSQI